MNRSKKVEGTKPVYKMRIEKDVYIPMRDGVKIAADVYRPDADGKFPALLAFSPFSKIDLSKENPYRLISYYNQLTQKMASIWHFTLYNDFFAMKYYEWLKTLCDDRDLSKFPNLHNNLLCGVHGMESVKPIHTIIHIAESIRKNQYYQITQ